MKLKLAQCLAWLRFALVRVGLKVCDAPLVRVRCRAPGDIARSAMSPRFGYEVRLDPRRTTELSFVILPIELLPNGKVEELDAWSTSESHPSLGLSVRRAVHLASLADMRRFDETTFLAS